MCVRWPRGDRRARCRARERDDEVVGMVAVSRPDAEILVVTERGFGSGRRSTTTG